MKASKILREGAQLIIQYGWKQGSYGSRIEGFCALGAMGTVSPYAHLAAAALSMAVPETNVQLWNDHPDQTKENVVRIMLKTAGELEELGQ
jgi:hypothetical protein